MKKLFFFRSSGSSNNSTVIHPSKTEKQDSLENPFEGPGLRRSRSLSSTAFFDDGKHKSFSGLSDQNRSQSGNMIGSLDQHRCRSSRCQTPPLGRQGRSKHFDIPKNDYESGTERPCSAASSLSNCDSSGTSSTCSSNVSSKILDRYIDDGEQQQEWSRSQSSIPVRNYPINGNGNGSGRRPPQIPGTMPSLPKYTVDCMPKSHPSEEFQSSNYHSSGKCSDNEYQSPRTIAKNVIERLSQSYAIPKASKKEFDNGLPVSIADMNCRSSKRCIDSNSVAVPQKFYSMNEPSEANFYDMDNSSFDRQDISNHSELLNPVETEDDVDGELWRKTKEAEDRVMLLTQELDQESFLQQGRVGVSTLIQTIRHMSEEKISLAVEVLSLLQSQITERASAKKEIRLAMEKLESQTRKLDREKNELQSELEKELDRRSSEWSSKLEKYQLEEQRLHGRVRELAEQNVSLQREVSSFNVRDTENNNIISSSEQKIKELIVISDKLRDENHVLMQNLSELQEKFKTTKEDRECFKRNFEEKERECKELYKTTTRLTRTCTDQQKTINGLQERFTYELGMNQETEKLDKHVAKLKMEQVRLTGVELSLRRELESCRVEIDSLRHENINILNRLKHSGKDNDAFTIKLDEEMSSRVCCLQHQGLALLNESSQLCAELLEFIKEKVHRVSEGSQGMEVSKNDLNGLYFIESEMKVQGLKRGTENLQRSLQLISSLLHEKSNQSASKVYAQCGNADGSTELNLDCSEAILKSELKTETLLTSLLREKLHSKEVEIEQLQAEIATAVRGNHILRCEVQNAMDDISCVTHKLKDLELQMFKKDDNVNRLQNDLEESTTELAIMRGAVPKIYEERDLMWDQVKQYSEKNMLLNSEVSLLKKKIEGLEEDILLKEGQITILKDSMRNKSFDLLGNTESIDEFLIR